LKDELPEGIFKNPAIHKTYIKHKEVERLKAREQE